MKIAKRIPLSQHYGQESALLEALSERESLRQIGLGNFRVVEREVPTVDMRADIVAYGDNQILVIESQFGQAGWSHWGCLECYAYYHNATMAALIADEFPQLMIDACQRRNDTSDIGWYLISVYIDSLEQHHFNMVVQPTRTLREHQGLNTTNQRAMDRVDPIFWQPIRDDENCIFAGKPVPPSNNYGIEKKIKGTNMYVRLQLRRDHASIRVKFDGEHSPSQIDMIKHRIPELPTPIDEWEYHNRGDSVTVTIKVIDKGRKDRNHWDKIRQVLVEHGTRIYENLLSIGSYRKQGEKIWNHG